MNSFTSDEAAAVAPWDGRDLAGLLTKLERTDPASASASASAGRDVLLSRAAQVNQNQAIFGGQQLGQVLAAAASTVNPAWPAHSLQHGFMAPGDGGQPLHFHVHRTLDSARFAMRHVLLQQRHGVVASANLSFHLPEEGPAHAAAMPVVPPPEGLPGIMELRNRAIPTRSSPSHRGIHNIVDMRPIDGEHFVFHRTEHAAFRFWIRLVQPLTGAGLHLRQAAFAYLSDYWLPLTALGPHYAPKFNRQLFLASLNHSIAFHDVAALQPDEWMLVDARSPFAGQGRGLTSAQIYSREGALLASVTQETLLRWRGSPQPAVTADVE